MSAPEQPTTYPRFRPADLVWFHVCVNGHAVLTAGMVRQWPRPDMDHPDRWRYSVVDEHGTRFAVLEPELARVVTQ